MSCCRLCPTLFGGILLNKIQPVSSIQISSRLDSLYFWGSLCTRMIRCWVSGMIQIELCRRPDSEAPMRRVVRTGWLQKWDYPHCTSFQTDRQMASRYPLVFRPPPSPPRLAMAIAMDTPATAEHFIFVTQVNFCGMHCRPALCVYHRWPEAVLAMCMKFSLRHAFLVWPPFLSADAVVIWDWTISLPREYRFVNEPCDLAHVINLLTMSSRSGGPIGLPSK